MHKDNVFVQRFKGLLEFVLWDDAGLNAVVGSFGAIGISGVQSWDRWKYFDRVDFLVWIKGVTFTEVWYHRIKFKNCNWSGALLFGRVPDLLLKA